MKRWAGFCLISILTILKAGAIEAVVAHTQFYLPEGKPYLEISWQADPASLRFMKDDNGRFISKIRTDITLTNEQGLLAEDHFILQTIPAVSLEVAKRQNITDLHRYMAAFGTVHAEIRLTDMTDTNNTFTRKLEIEIDRHATSHAYYSGIQLLDTFYTSTEKSIFLKNDRQQLPLSSNFIDDYRSNLRFYAELYQTNTIPTEQYPLVQRVFVSKKTQETAVYNLKTTDTIQPGAVLPYLGSLNIDVLPSGNYYLNLALENNRGETIASNSIFFQRSNKSPVSLQDSTADDSMQHVNILDLNNTFVGKFNIPKLRAILKMIQPISTPVEAGNIKTFLKRPDLIYMQYFVYNFWSARNKKDPKKAWEQYADKVREVNKLFGRGAYETDRGHVYLKYGKPTERVIVENEQGSLPYEVWQYNEVEVMSNALFLFYRPANMVSDMLLLHSTVPGEMRNMNWRQQLYVQGISGDHTNSRVEQYLYK